MARADTNAKSGHGSPVARADRARRKAARPAATAAFDLDDPVLPAAIEEAAIGSGGYPYDRRLDKKTFDGELRALQIELRKLQAHVQATGERILVLFEGRDAAGKGTCINHFMQHLNPRQARAVALSKPTEQERGQWYFQRYLSHLPSAGEIVLFDRSWYNRAGVERVMGFCTEAQLADFLRDTSDLEEILVRDGIRLFKIYLDIGREMQLKRFHERRHDPLKHWKITGIDLAAMGKWDDYTRAKKDMFHFTHTAIAPWTVVRANDQRRARLEAIRVVLTAMSYEGRDAAAVGQVDPRIVGAGPAFFETT